MKYSVSVALCTYNGTRFLPAQLESIARQTLPPDELVVFDDGSTDTTLELIGKFSETAAFPVRVFKNEHNLGTTKNFECAISACNGDLIALCDQDDEWYPEKLALMHRLFEEYPQALAAFSDADIVDDGSVPTGRKLWKSYFFAPRFQTAQVDTDLVLSLFKHNYIATGATMVFRSELRPQVIPIPELWDHDAWISWIAALRGGLASVPRPTIAYRVHQRQQIGVPPPSLAGRIAISWERNFAFYQLFIRRFKILRQYLEQRGGDKQLAGYIPALDEKIRHLEGQASENTGVLRRLCRILSSWRDYRRFARGPRAMFFDAFLVKREKPSK